MSVFEDIALLVQQGKAKDVVVACQKALDEGATAQKVLDSVLTDKM